MALTAKAQNVLEKMQKAAPYMTDKTLDFILGAATALLLQHEHDSEKPDSDPEKKPA